MEKEEGNNSVFSEDLQVMPDIRSDTDFEIVSVVT